MVLISPMGLRKIAKKAVFGRIVKLVCNDFVTRTLLLVQREGRKNKKKESYLKKRRILGVVLAIVLLAVAVPAIAAHVGSLSAQTTVVETISITSTKEAPEKIEPGDLFGFGGEVRNHSDTNTYGMIYQWYLWLISPVGEKTEVTMEENEEGELGLWSNDTKGGPPICVGSIQLFVGSEPYTPGEIRNLGPGAMHELKALVETSKAMDTGELIATVMVQRVAPQ
jgi:hypothetical protein